LRIDLATTSAIASTPQRLWGLGYGVAVKDPYCITLMRSYSIIDLYVHPSLGGVIFIDGGKLLEIVRNPEKIVYGHYGRRIAQGLRVVYEEDEKILVTTVYPCRRERYR